MRARGARAQDASRQVVGGRAAAEQRPSERTQFPPAPMLSVRCDSWRRAWARRLQHLHVRSPDVTLTRQNLLSRSSACWLMWVGDANTAAAFRTTEFALNSIHA